MSRHKLVKQLDLSEELADYDGGVAHAEDEYNPGTMLKTKVVHVSIGADSRLYPVLISCLEESEQLREGTIQVRDVLGPSIQVTDQEIQESLWHYYYDVEKSVNYLLNKKASSNQKKINEKTGQGSTAADVCFVHERPCSGQFVVADFFKDAPWFNIPPGRQGEILVEPLYPPGRLLGGSSSQGNGKVSKLAAIAAARRRKENTRPESSNVVSSVAILDRLGSKKSQASADGTTAALEATTATSATPARVGLQNNSRRYPVRERKLSVEASQLGTTAVKESTVPASEATSTENIVITHVASPSAFARTMLGYRTELVESSDRDSKCLDPPASLPHHFSLGASETKIDAFAEPSPDDVVLKAQSLKGSKAAKFSQEEEIKGISKAIGNATISEAPRAKSKNLDVVAEFAKKKAKPAANFVVIGHVDAGKSTLMGRLLYDLKVVDQRTLDKYRKEADGIGKSSFALAWVLDQGSDERSQGVTIDIGMNKFETEKAAFTILDAPGHRDFIPNMIAGASQADFAILVIDSSTGNFESGLKGQTKEHALLVRSMGVQRMIVVVNKLDTLAWSRDRFDEIQQQVSAFLTAAGFQSRNLTFLPCSGLTGENVVSRATDRKASWYAGPPLVSLLESSEPFTRAIERPLRLTIDDIFRGGVQNPLSVSGRIDAGSMQTGDIIVTVPSNETASVKRIEIGSEPNDWAVAGQNVTLHLTDIEQKYLRTGDVLCPPSAPVISLSSFTIKVLAFEHILPMAVEVHRGRLHAPGRISKLIAVLDKASGKPVEGGKKKVKIVKPGHVARVVVEVDEPVPLEIGGKVVLRAEGHTVGAGLLE